MSHIFQLSDEQYAKLASDQVQPGDPLTNATLPAK